MTPARWIVLALALALGALALVRLDGLRAGLVITPLEGAAGTPATVWRLPGDEPAPVAVIAHGFAGSRQLMEGFAITLARAGHIAVTFDFEGHGRNPAPMSGDVTRIDGTTQKLMDEVARVSDAALRLPGADGRLSLVGHSMASDIVVRQAIRDPRVGAVVAVSMFSEAVTADAPRNLLIVTGAWERFLSAEALRALRLADPRAQIGQTLGAPADRTGRRAVLAPSVEHVGVLYSAMTLRETRDWLAAATGQAATGEVALRGGWIALLLGAVVALAWPLAALLRRFRTAPPPRLAAGPFALAVIGPAVAVPLLLWPFDTRFLPVLVADYLALHFALYGLLGIAVVAVAGGWRRGGGWLALGLALPVLAYCLVLFGGALDRHVASFFPSAARVPVLLVMACGAVPFMLADAALTAGGAAGLGRVLAVRTAALASLGLAVALDFERLFFLIIILPVILLYFLLFGMIGGWVGRATRRPAVSGIALGLFLAWALGVTFPMFAA